MTFYIHKVDFEEDIEGFLAQRGIIVNSIDIEQDWDHMFPKINIVIEGEIVK